MCCLCATLGTGLVNTGHRWALTSRQGSYQQAGLLHSPTHALHPLPQDYPVGCTWTLLYSSAQHGFSLNRFVHHSSDYRDPTITLLHCHAPTGEDYLFAIAVDTEWK